MKKRMLISGLWFLSVWGIGGALHLFLDVPRVTMLVPAIAVAAAWWVGLARYDAAVETRGMARASMHRYGPESAVRTTALEA